MKHGRHPYPVPMTQDSRRRLLARYPKREWMTMKTMRQTLRHSRKGQSLIEFAFGALLLVLLLAAAVDFGRAFYTYVVVQNMAGEAATFLSGQPDNDVFSPHYAGPDNNTFQFRARNVAARVMG